MGASPLTYEHVRSTSEPNYGAWEDVPLPLGLGRQAADGAILGTATDPQYEVADSLHFIEWGAADTDGVVFTIPSGQIATRHGKIQLVGRVALVGANGNNDVDLLATMTVKPRFATKVAAANPTKVTVRTAADDDTENISEMATPADGARIPEVATEAGSVEVVWEFDVPAAMDAGADLMFTITPDQAPVDDLRLFGLDLRIPRHGSLARRFDRQPMK